MLELRNVTKRLKGMKVLDNVSYKFEPGTVYGLYGVNGSGKTMFLRMAAGLIVPTEGEVFWNGRKLHEDISFPGNVGIVIEHMELLPRFTGRENLLYLSKIKKLVGNEEIESSLKRVGLERAMDLKVKKYSLGMKQRLNIAQAVFEGQELILLDEPTNALDDDGIRLIYDVVKKEKERGAIIIIATHHKDDLESMCDVLLKMQEGRLYQ